MKKITLLMFVLTTFWSYSQVKSYTFSQTIASSYTEITAGTLLGNSSNGDQKFVDPGVLAGGATATGVGLPIGFNFTYNGASYNKFAVATDGWITLGTSANNAGVAMYATFGSSPLSNNNQITPEILATKIAALGGNLAGQTNSSLRFETLGDAPNRVLIVQWKNYKKFYDAVGDSFNFQIKLYETSNKLEFVYGTMTTATTASQVFQVGLRAEPSTSTTNFVDRKSTTGWDNTTAGTSAADGVSMDGTFKPALGLTYTWTPPTCGSPKNLVVSTITETTAMLSWGFETPTPSSYEYVVTTSATLPTTAGTSTVGSTVSLTDLVPNSGYNVYIRSLCGTEVSQWSLAGTFRTKCLASDSYTENFDSYSANSAITPYCWELGGTNIPYITTGSNYPGSAPNALYMLGTGTIPTTTSYAVLPKVSNLKAETHRLKFKAYATTTNRKLDIGYFTDASDVNSFVFLRSVDLPSSTAASAQEFAFSPVSIPDGVKCLGFRNRGLTTGTTILYIDDVIWEPIPPCSDVKSLVVDGILSTSAKLKWTPTGTETAWQYAFAPSTVKDPSKLIPVNADATTQTITGLSPVSPYHVWVRSKCGDASYGSWIGPVNFTTTCTTVTEFAQNFDASTSFPTCWKKLGTNVTPSIQYTYGAPSGANTLYVSVNSPASKAVVVMEPVGNSAAGTHRLKFKFRANAVGAIVEVGYLTNIYDADSFVTVQTYLATSTAAYDEIITGLSTLPTTPYLAFRIPGSTSSSITMYIDDVVWEPTPTTCPDVSALKIKATTSNSVGLGWTTSGTESQWQYVVGTATTDNPYSLTAKDFDSAPSAIGTLVSGTVNGLTHSTTYKMWVRSKCVSVLGAWIGPLTVNTTCAPVAEFMENFNLSTALPACWTRVGTGGSVDVTTLPEPNSSKLIVIGGTPSSSGLVSLPPVSNSAAGTHRLRFKFRGPAIEVGYLMNPADPFSFDPLKTFTSTSTSEYTEVATDFSFMPASQVLGLRNPGEPQGNVYIDDVVWEPIPNCAQITTLAADLVTSDSISISWTAGGTESAWQYVVGGSTETNPNAMTPTAVTATSVTINKLMPSTSYKIWLRSNCGNGNYGVWTDPLYFTTNCAPVTEFSQSFDDGLTLPACWNKVGTGGYVGAKALDGPTSPNVLYITSLTSSQGTVALPPVSNIAAGTHRLRFKFRGSVANSTLEIGYLTNMSDPNSFVLFEAFASSSTTEFEIKKSLIASKPNMQVLAFRNTGSPVSTIHIDDVVWEPIPSCPDIKKVTINGTTSTSTNLSWITDSTATAWQYVIGSLTDINPNPLAVVTVDTPAATIMKLTPNTSYKVWVRTKCGDNSFGAWSDPLSFITNCDAVTVFEQNFDTNTAIPYCWKQVGNLGTVTVSAKAGASIPNVLTLDNNAIVAMPNVTNASAGTHRLKYKFSSSVIGGTLEVGYLTDINDATTFIPLETYEASSTSTFDSKVAFIDPIAAKPLPGSVLAFRNPATTAGFVYVDNVVWEPIPTCADVDNVAVKLPTSNSVQLTWDSTGTEKAWQYAVASSAITNPGSLPSSSIVDTNLKALTVGGLTPNTSYKIWVRSSCGSGIYGLWMPSVVFMTPCPSVVTINENFDSNLNLPDCWRKMSVNGNMAVVAEKGFNATNALELKSPAPSSEVFAAIPPLSSAMEGGYRMKFKCMADYSSTKIEIVCFKDPASFSEAPAYTVLKSLLITSGNTGYAIDEMLPASETPYLGFKIYNANAVTTVLIDDFVWEMPVLPNCATGVTVTPNANCGNFATNISWDADDNAAGYRLTIGTTSGASDVMNNVNVGKVLTYSFIGNVNTTYYYTIKPFNGKGDATGCPVQTFTTVANGCYCTSAPYNKNGTGITNVQIGAADFVNQSVTYADHSDKPVQLALGANSNLKVAFNTDTEGYYTNVWVDFNDNYEFELEERVFTGKAAAFNPAVLDASFMMPATAPMGTHGMRIGAVRVEQVPANPCFAGLGGVTLDFKVNVVAKLGVDTFATSNFNYYPNPVQDVLNISLDQEISDVVVLNLLGQQVISKSVNSNETAIDMSSLSKGTYLVKITAGSQSKTIKAIKE